MDLLLRMVGAPRNHVQFLLKKLDYSHQKERADHIQRINTIAFEELVHIFLEADLKWELTHIRDGLYVARVAEAPSAHGRSVEWALRNAYKSFLLFSFTIGTLNWNALGTSQTLSKHTTTQDDVGNSED